MKRAIFLVLAFLCFGLFVCNVTCAPDCNAGINTAQIQKTHICNTQGEFVNYSGHDAHFVSQNTTQTLHNFPQRRLDATFFGAYAPSCKNMQYFAILKYINDKSELKNKNNFIAFSNEILTRAP